jgi:hypothetical protein
MLEKGLRLEIFLFDLILSFLALKIYYLLLLQFF